MLLKGGQINVLSTMTKIEESLNSSNSLDKTWPLLGTLEMILIMSLKRRFKVGTMRYVFLLQIFWGENLSKEFFGD